MTRDLILDIMGVAAISLTTIVTLWLPALLQA